MMVKHSSNAEQSNSHLKEWHMCKCFECGNDIPDARLEFVPDTEYCVNCADKHTFKSVARIIYSHKADCELFIARTNEDARRLNREYSRAR